jgi:hypothetical protein
MESKEVNLQLTDDEAGSLSFHLGLITRPDVFQVLEERKLSNQFDRQILINIKDRLMQMAGEKYLGVPRRED